jgi:hypothetical protein
MKSCDRTSTSHFARRSSADCGEFGNGFEFGKLLNQNELQRSDCQSRLIRPLVLDRIGGTAICPNALEGNEKRLVISYCDALSTTQPETIEAQMQSRVKKCCE